MEPRLTDGLTYKLNGRYTWSVLFTRFPLSGCKIECYLDFETEKEAESNREETIEALKKELNKADIYDKEG